MLTVYYPVNTGVYAECENKLSANQSIKSWSVTSLQNQIPKKIAVQYARLLTILMYDFILRERRLRHYLL
jgi:hypothetical protein